MPKRKCIFSIELQTKFPMMKKGKYDWKTFCTIYSTNISIANKGATDINEHLNTQKHKTNLKNQASTSNIATFMIRSSSEDHLIRAAESAILFHTIYHHMSFKSLDCTNALNRELFSGSDIATKMTCNRTKTTSIANNVLNPNTNFGGREQTAINNVFHNQQVILNSNIVGVRCFAHIIHNAVHHGCDLLPLDMELSY